MSVLCRQWRRWPILAVVTVEQCGRTRIRHGKCNIICMNYAEYTKKQYDELGVEFALIKTGAAASPDLDEGYNVEEATIEASRHK